MKRTFLRSIIMVMMMMLTSFASYGLNIPDTMKRLNLYRPHLQKDTIVTLTKLQQDSILARENFVKDSILRHQQIMDSLIFLQGALQPLLDAVQWTITDDIISHTDKIAIIGDSVLSDYTYYKMLFVPTDPYSPWKGRFNLNAKGTHFNLDKNTKSIKSIQAPFLNCNFYYTKGKIILIIQEDYSFQNTYAGSFYKIPIDTVFYDNNKRIVKIKRYVQFYKMEANYRKGEFLFTNLTQVKQYKYDSNNQITYMEVAKFRERFKSYDSNEATYITAYTLTKQGNNYLITRRNKPENAYSDGTFSIDMDGLYNITCVSFRNSENILQSQRYIVVNKDGNVGCYIDKKDGVKFYSICMVYHNEPNAKYPVEIIHTSFEKDGTDMYQKNVTTQQSRSRDKMTLEWGPWK
jgi:hypothetical protein